MGKHKNKPRPSRSRSRLPVMPNLETRFKLHKKVFRCLSCGRLIVSFYEGAAPGSVCLTCLGLSPV